MKFKVGQLVFLSQKRVEKAYGRRHLAPPAVGEYFRPVHKNERGVWVASPDFSFLVQFGVTGLILDHQHFDDHRDRKYILLFGDRICMHAYDIAEELFEEFTSSTPLEELQERDASSP